MPTAEPTPQGDDQLPPKLKPVPPRGPGRQDKGGGNLFLGSSLGVLALLCFATWLWLHYRPNIVEMQYSDFYNGVREGTVFNTQTMSRVMIGHNFITFHFEPAKLRTAAESTGDGSGGSATSVPSGEKTAAVSAKPGATETPSAEAKPSAKPAEAVTEKPVEKTAEKTGSGGAAKPEESLGTKLFSLGEPVRDVASLGDQPCDVVVPFLALQRDLPALTQLLREKGIPFASEYPTSEVWGFLNFWMPMILMMGLIYFFFRRMFGAGAAMSIGRSRGRLYAQEDMEISFEDIAGIDEVVDELKEIVDFLKSPEKYQMLGGRIPRGVLLVGPPGTGKTLLAKAVAGEAGVPFFSLSGSDFMELYVGVGAARVRDLFAQAGMRSPCIIFIDEIDALGKIRTGGGPGGHDEREQTLNALLVEMDGFSSDQSVIVMGATNRPEMLDPALLRPGRFDRRVLVDRPDVRGREAILKVHIKKVKAADDVDLKKIARITAGFVGADLANLVNEATLLAARKEKKKVTMEEFEEGLERVVAGLEKQSRVITPEVKQRVAYHETGHALVSRSLPHTDPVHKVSIIPRGMALGYMMPVPREDRTLITQAELENNICVMLGGIACEHLIFQETSTGAQNDLERATETAREMVMEFGMSPRMGRVNYRETRRAAFMPTMAGDVGYNHSPETLREIDLEVKRIVDQGYHTALNILTTRRKALEHVAKELVEKEVINAEDLERILELYPVTPHITPGTTPPGLAHPPVIPVAAATAAVPHPKPATDSA